MLSVIFLFLGLDSISSEIENPFGYDWNDLPLDAILSQLNSDLVQV
jgi:ion channel-forming bestrophin family protein